MKNLSFLLTLSLLFLFSCSVDEIGTNEQLNTDNSELELLSKNNTNGIIHHVSAGGNDACESWGGEPGCDRNYSLTANMMADGTVKGQFIDGWGGDNPHAGIHADITCMFVDGNMAKLGGIVTKGQFPNGYDLTGEHFFAVLKDNGTSNSDTPDEISYTFLFLNDVCEYADEFFYEEAEFAITKGQVVVW